jgi:hypothetical protein
VCDVFTPGRWEEVGGVAVAGGAFGDWHFVRYDEAIVWEIYMFCR